MKTLRLLIAVLFLLAGSFKLCALRGFAAVLAQSGAPVPRFFALAVPLLEIGGGAALLLNRYSRLAAMALAVDMICAVALVGGPGARGIRFRAGSYTVGGEVWRVPLEVALLVGLVLIASYRDGEGEG